MRREGRGLRVSNWKCYQKFDCDELHSVEEAKPDELVIGGNEVRFKECDADFWEEFEDSSDPPQTRRSGSKE